MAEAKKVGRPKGKRSDRSYCQVCGYVKVNTYKQVKHLLIDEDREFSELIQQLLDEWILLKQKGKKTKTPNSIGKEKSK